MWDHALSLICFAQEVSDSQWNLMPILTRNPWIVVVALGLTVPVASIVVGGITNYLRKTKLAQIDADLKRDMLDRGMTPEQIKMVIEATSSQKSRRGDGGCC